MRPLALPAAAVLLAACLTAPPAPLAPLAPQAAAGPAPATEVPIELTGCAYLEAPVRVLPLLLDPHVPDDFTLATSAGLAFLNLGVAACREAVSGSDAGTGRFGFLLARIAEPEDPALLGAGVTVYFYRLEHYTLADDVYARVAQAAGVDRIVVDRLDADVRGAPSAGRIAGAGLDHQLTVPASPPGVGGVLAPVHWREYHAVPGGYAYLDAFLLGGPTSGALPGVVVASGGAAQAVYPPAAASAGTLYGEDFGILDARMGVVPYP